MKKDSFEYKLIKLFVDFVVLVGKIALYPFEYVIFTLKKYDIKNELRVITNIFKKVDLEKTIKKHFTQLKYFLRIEKKPKKRGRPRKETTKKAKAAKVKAKKISPSGKLTAFIYGVLFSIFFIFLPLVIYQWYKDLPRPELLSQTINKSTKILDRKGRLLYEIYIDKNYDPVALETIPDHVKQATIAIEDNAFYSHYGIRPVSMLRAAKTTLIEGDLQGGSTITQQLVKNVLLTPERTIGRKAKEIAISVMVERIYTKDEILEMYLNNIAYGGTAWGIQSASEKFFGKSVDDLTLAEGSFLAGLPSSPSSYSPFLGGFEKAKERQKQVLDEMVSQGYISRVDANQAFSEELNIVSQQGYIRAPHFVNYVRGELEKEYGSRMVDLGGLTVTTTLDVDLQDKVQQIVADEITKSSWLKISNGAAIVMDTKNGEILAYVGSADYFNKEIDGNVDIITSYRQPGSSVKPITYALAFQNGMTPASTIEDKKITFTFEGQPPYTPVNYDGQYHGTVTLRQALANSYNIPAVKLANKLSPDNIVKLGNALGLKHWLVDNSYGISITLGGKEVRLIDLTNVFASFSRGGVYKNTKPFISVKDSKGYEIYSYSDESNRVLEEEIAYLITNILSDNNVRAATFGYNSPLNIPGHPVAVKTGTTDAKRDNWTIGYTPSLAVGVWVGNNDNSPMHPYLSSGISGAAPIWNRIMSLLLAETPPEEFIQPEKVIVKFDPDCNNSSEVFIKGTAPAHLCDPSKEDN